MLTYKIKELDRFSEKIVVQHQVWNDRKAFPTHTHDFIEVIYAIRGNGTNIIDHFAYPVIAGDLYIIRPGSLHSFYSCSELAVYNLMFSLSLFSAREKSLLKENENFREIFMHPSDEEKYNKISLSPEQSSVIGAYFTELYRELKQRKQGCRLLSKALLVMLLTAVCRSSAGTAMEKKRQESGEDEFNSLSKILEFINGNYLTELTRARIAAAGHLNVNYVSEFFRRHTGMTPLKYINSLRIETARKLLISRPDLNMGEIALRSGFTDACYFTRVFHTLYGCSPTAFRKKVEDGSEVRRKTHP